MKNANVQKQKANVRKQKANVRKQKANVQNDYWPNCAPLGSNRKSRDLSTNPFTPFLTEQGIIILDGALATELAARGADIDDPLWSAKVLLDNPELIRQLHYEYFVAGANVAITASYQASFPGLAARGLSHDAATDLMRLSVQLALTARDDYANNTKTKNENENGPLMPLVAASVGPYGAYLHNGAEYTGDYGLTVEELIDWHRPRLQVLAESGADLLACETIPSLAEGEALVRLLAEFPKMPAWLSFSCCDGEHICHGERFRDAVALANESDQIVAIGVNCTPPQYVESLLQQAEGVTDKPLLAYPNSGEQWDATAHCWLPGTGEADFAQAAMRWYEAGARLLGGCCRTRPADIEALRRQFVR
ncbi:MAG: homocysteine S-methyltransferase [Caldilineaceae bacterium]|nr:homocysteine S-methyltransferase [Caldilineaceae bacterium]